VLALLGPEGLQPRPQDHARATYAPKLTRDTARIRWSEPATGVARLIRGLDPRPGAWTELDGREVKLFSPHVVDGHGAPGTILAADDALRIAAGEGAVAVVDVQPAGKPRMAVADWIHGRGARTGQRFV
jgi:methionyl-tRNA formyltransferase